MSDRLAFAAPVPAAASSGAGLFDFFSAFRASVPQSGLFVANLEPPDINAGLPRRLGTVTNTLGPFWRSDTSLFGFALQEDGTLALRSIDAASGVVRDLGVRLPAGIAQGVGLAARWDTDRGRALLLSRPSSGTSPLRAWLVSFAAPGSTTGAGR